MKYNATINLTIDAENEDEFNLALERIDSEFEDIANFGGVWNSVDISFVREPLDAALKLIVEDLTENNAHTIAALVESQYRTGYDSDKVLRAYKAAQFELFGTR